MTYQNASDIRGYWKIIEEKDCDKNNRIAVKKLNLDLKGEKE